MIVDGSLLEGVRGNPRVGVLVVDEYMPVPAYVEKAQARFLSLLSACPMWAFTNNGRDLRSGLLLPKGTSVIDKPRANAFAGTDLQKRILDKGVTDLVVMGYHRDACVAATIGHLWKGAPDPEDFGAVNFGFKVHTHLHIVHGGSSSKKRDRPLWYAAARIPEIPEGDRLLIYREI